VRHQLALLFAAGVATLLTLVGGCRSDTGDLGTAQQSTNVLLIAVDTLRADRLGCYGSDLGATPRIDALTADGVRFERAFAHAPWTLPSFASLYTSQAPPEHGAGGSRGTFRWLSQKARTVAECFRDAGYATAAVVNVDFLGKEFGMAQGFDHLDCEAYANNVQVRSAGRTTDAAVKWLRQPRERAFFLLVHYFDPHLVYAPPAEFRRRFAAAQDRDESRWVFGRQEEILAYRRGQVRFDARTIRRAQMLYNGEVAYTDHEVGRLLDALDDLGLTSSTLVIFTADHGEEFLDHGSFEHGHTLYNELVHIPLIFRHPGRVEPRVVSEMVGHIDVAPTICELAGVAPEPTFCGRSLAGLLTDGGTWEARPIVLAGNMWGPPLQGWIDDGHKLVRDLDGVKLFDLRRDFGEIRDLAGTAPKRLTDMLAKMIEAFEALVADRRTASRSVELSDDVAKRLESLGYVDLPKPADEPVPTTRTTSSQPASRPAARADDAD
jgi:choline-sulfatase